MNLKTGALLLLVGSMGLLGACAVDPTEIKVAEKTCATHGGIKYLYAFPYTEVLCNDGFLATSLKPKKT